MGSAITKVFQTLIKQREYQILLLGLDFAGKSTILSQLESKKFTEIPIIQENVETLKYKNYNFISWDLGGNDKIRRLWKPYFSNTQGIIFVIDVADKERIHIAKEELNYFLREEELKDAPVVIFANKSDIGSMTICEVAEELGLCNVKDRDWYIQETCAFNGDGLNEGLEWLTFVMAKKWK